MFYGNRRFSRVFHHGWFSLQSSQPVIGIFWLDHSILHQLLQSAKSTLDVVVRVCRSRWGGVTGGTCFSVRRGKNPGTRTHRTNCAFPPCSPCTTKLHYHSFMCCPGTSFVQESAHCKAGCTSKLYVSRNVRNGPLHRCFNVPKPHPITFSPNAAAAAAALGARKMRLNFGQPTVRTIRPLSISQRSVKYLLE